MPRPLKKPSDRLKKPGQDAGFKPDENSLEIFRKQLFRWINTRLGWGWGAVLVAVFALWLGWDKVAKLPGISVVLTQLDERSTGIPRVNGDKFSVLIAKLGNDNDGVHRKLLEDALLGKLGNEVEVLWANRRITISSTDRPQEAVKAGHERAQALLREANANVMIWGEALDTKTDAPLRLHWTVNERGDFKSSEKYVPADRSLDLPQLFWTDLSDVLGLLATSQATAFSSKRGSYVADQLEPFIKRVRLLVASGNLAVEKKADLRLILADGLQAYGEQRGDIAALQEAVSVYRESLKDFTRERTPLQWATTQNNLGVALGRLGVTSLTRGLKSGRAQLDEAVTAHREALKERTRERVPLQWATTQNNLGSALTKLAQLDELGSDESRTTRLNEAVSAFHEALKEYTREPEPLMWATIQNNLGTALLVLSERESGTARLEEAVSAFQEALKELTPDRAPRYRAKTQESLTYAEAVLRTRRAGKP